MYHRLKTFSCEAYAHVSKEFRAKLDLKLRKCIFIGYGLDCQFGYRLWDPESRSIIRCSDVVFNETKMHKQPMKEVKFQKVTFFDVSPSINDQQTAQEPAVPQVVDAPVERANDEASTSQPRRSQRVSYPPD